MKKTKARPTGQEDPFAMIEANAAAADLGWRGLEEDIKILQRTGILDALTATGCEAVRDQVQLLRRLGRANLSVGRLAEGHMNAITLLRLYATPAQCQRHLAAAAGGRIFGVWGAEDAVPLTIADGHGGAARLAGGKRFCSGLGIVGTAVLTAGTDQGPQLVLADVTETSRHDHAIWTPAGMRATVSGACDLHGMRAELLGRPGDYQKEPHFEGGVWRYAALQVGALEALADHLRAAFADVDPGPHNRHRLARLALAARAARLLVEDAALQTVAGGDPWGAAALSLLAREGVERACVEAIATVDRALGTRTFFAGHPVERIRRDLGFFLRQADLDGKLERAARWLLKADGSVGELWNRS